MVNLYTGNEWYRSVNLRRYRTNPEEKENMMKVKINIKQMGKKGRRIKPIPFEYAGCPATAEELIEETVDIMLDAFKKKMERSAAEEVEGPLSEETISAMAEMGKVAFGFIYNDKTPDRDEAVETARMAYVDGLVRIFINGEEAEYQEGGTPISLSEGDEVTFVRLAFLAGRMW